jgi:hypothetical protein
VLLDAMPGSKWSHFLPRESQNLDHLIENLIWPYQGLAIAEQSVKFL